MYKFIIPALLTVALLAGCGTTTDQAAKSGEPVAAKVTPAATETPEATPEATPEPVKTYTGNKSFLKAVGRGESDVNVKKLVGKVFNIDHEDGAIALQMWLDDDADEQAIVYIYDEDFDVSEEDYLSVSGTLGDDFEGQNAMGADMSAPTVQASRYKIVTAKAMHPTLSKSPWQSTSIGGISYTVQAEFAADQTRFVIKAINNTGESEYISDPDVVSNGNQKDSDYNFDLKSLSSELSPGAKTKGTLVFKKLKKGSIQMNFEGYDADYNEITQSLYF
jgi:hypothetical protein